MTRTSTTTSMSLPGLTLLEEIGRGAFTTVLRATRDGREVAVKMPHGGAVGVRESVALRFTREAALLACLSHPGLPRIHTVDEHEGMPYLVMELIAGDTLTRRIDAGPLPTAELTHVAIEVASALACVHRGGLIHRDIKPDNVILDHTDHPHLIDFGFARHVPEGDPHGEVVGTFVYTAPEQAGALDRPVDARSDLYALGVTLYQCATGAPPFAAPDVGALIRMHAVAEPAPPNTRGAALPAPLEAILLKLLAKDPDDRYQTAEGLIYDLRAVLARPLESWAGVEGFELGRRDDARRRDAGLPLIGRARELAQLDEAWSRAREAPQITLLKIEGAPGCGKTRLLSAFLTRRSPETPVLVARCRAGEAVPLAALRDALDEAVTWLERAPASRTALRDATHMYSGLLRTLSPRLAELYADTPEERRGEDEHDALFFTAIATFLRAFSRVSPSGCVLVLDDAHGLDDASLQVLRHLLRERPGAPLLIIASAREESTSRLRGCDTLVRLGPLDEEGVRAMLEAELGGRPVDPRFVAQIARRSQGVPFAVREYLRAMLEGGLMRPAWDHWEVDFEGLQSLELPEDVLDLVRQRLHALSPETRDALRVAAVLGVRCERVVLERVCASLGATAEASPVHARLTRAMEAHVLEASGEGRVQFVHDRIREAILGELDAATRQRLHQQAAETLDAVESSEVGRLFALAHHYAQGDITRRPERVFETNLRAGSLAMADHAHDEARQCFENAARCRPEALARQVELDRAMGELAVRERRFPEALEALDRAVQGSPEGSLERAWLHSRVAEVHCAKLDFDPAETALDAAFEALGETRPRGRLGSTVGDVAGFAARALERRFNLFFGKARGEERERRRLLVRLYEQVGLIGFFCMDDLTMVQAGLGMLRYAHRVGPSAELVTAYCNHGALLAILGREQAAQGYLERAHATAEALGDRTAIAQAHHFEAVACEHLGDTLRAARLQRESLERYGPWIAGLEFVDASIILAWNLELRGYTRDAWGWVQRVMERLDLDHQGERPDIDARDHPHGYDYAASLLATLGEREQATRFLEANARFLDAHTAYPYPLTEFLGHSVLYHLEMGELGEPLERVLERHAALELSPNRIPIFLRHVYVYAAYARLLQRRHAEEAESDAAQARLERALAALRKAATVPLLRAHERVITATAARLEGEDADRIRATLDEASALGDAVDAPWVAFGVACERARLFAQEENTGASARHARLAHDIATAQGWRGRARDVQARFSVGTSRARSAAASTAMTRVGSASVRVQRHLHAMLQVSAAISHMLDPDKQALVALDEIVRIFNAERGFLFACSDAGELTFKLGRDLERAPLESESGYSGSIVERCALERSALLVSAGEDGVVIQSQSVLTHNLRSVMAAPLLFRGELEGVLYLDNRMARGVFTEEDAEVLQAMAHQLAVAMNAAHTAQLEIRFEAERQQRRFAEAMRDFTTALASTLDLDEVFLRLIARLQELVGFDRGLIIVFEEGAGAGSPPPIARLIASTGSALDDALEAGLRASLAQHPELERLCAQGEAIIARGQDAALLDYGAGPMRAWFLLARDNAPLAALLFEHDDPRRAYDDAQRSLIGSLTAQAVIAVQNARLFAEVERLATTDPLTRLPNRRQLFDLASRELERARRYERALSMLVFDIDHFKRVNDTWGHQAGDEVLVGVASRGLDALRQADIMARFGGEEFVVLLPETGPEEARVVAERVRRAVASAPFHSDGQAIPVTISVGVGVLNNADDHIQDVFSRADAALYLAKASGRDQVRGEDEVESSG